MVDRSCVAANLTRLVLEHMVVDVKPEEGSVDGERGVVIMVSSAAAVSTLS